MGIFSLKRSSIILILIMLGIFLAGIWYADQYYGHINAAEDPRVIRAKEMYRDYNTLAAEKKYHEILDLLDSIERIYNSYEDYKDSYEIGVLYNNRAAIYLNLILYEALTEVEQDSLTNLSLVYLSRSILTYETWKAAFENFTANDLRAHFTPIYREVFPMKDSSQILSYVSKRIDEMQLAQKEVNRRLSVSYTNLGIVQKQMGHIKEAIRYYDKALVHWPENLTAKNNINVLIGKPLERRSLIDRLFPKERDE